MINSRTSIELIGIQFFSKILSSISHELKNKLSVISQSAGLIEDVALMAEQGISLTYDRLGVEFSKITSHVEHANEILNNMNQFGHSLDEVFKKTDIGDVLSLVIKLCSRFASMKGVTLELKLPTNKLILETNTYYMENLIYLCLMCALNSLDHGEKLTISMDIHNKNNPQIKFEPFNLEKLQERDNIFDTHIKELSHSLNVDVLNNMESKTIIIALSETDN